MKKFLFLLLLSIIITIPARLKAQGIDKPVYQIETHRAGSYLGTFTVELFPLIAPLATANFDSLVNAQAYDSTAFHRVVPGFVIQGGDPNSINGPVSTWGQGNPNQPTVPAEFSVVRHLRGRLGAARDTDTNSANSQFYICVANATFLDGQYTVYGQVTSGMEVVDTIVNSPRDANDVPLQKIEMFITYIGVNDSIPDAPALISPADQSTGILNTQTFQWTTVNSAVMYTIQFSTDSLFSTIDYWRNAGIASTTLPWLGGNTTYYWRVISNNGGHESMSGNVYSLTTASAAPGLIYPANLDTGIPLSLIFRWSNVPGADYRLQVSKNSVFTSGAMVYDQSGLIDTNQLVGSLLPNFLYYWRVQSSIAGVAGNYSSKFSFHTGTSVGINDVEVSKNELIKTVYPNPAKDLITVKGFLNRPCTVKIFLKSATGKIVYIVSKKFSRTDYSMVINVSKLNKGVYLLVADADGGEETRKIEIH